jgi:hypothetical protein
MIVDEKDSSDQVDYTIDWSAVLGQDTIALSTWLIPTGLTGVSASKTSSTTTMWVLGGVANSDYYCANRITTTDGRKIDRYVVVPVRNL